PASLVVDGLFVREDRGQRAVEEFSLIVRRGEIFGIAGVDGNGQAELVETLVGLRDIEAGRIRLEGAEISRLSRRERMERGLGYIPADRWGSGLIAEMSIAENLFLHAYR